jgi:hypothetical protein
MMKYWRYQAYNQARLVDGIAAAKSFEDLLYKLARHNFQLLHASTISAAEYAGLRKNEAAFQLGTVAIDPIPWWRRWWRAAVQRITRRKR